MNETSVLAEASQYLLFIVGDEEFGVNLQQVKELIAYAPPTPVPLTPECIRGVINLRGSVVPVIDLAAKFKFQKSAINKRNCIIVLEVEQDGAPIIMGVIADAVDDVVPLTAADISAAPSFGTKVHVDYLRGVGKIGEKFILLVDIPKVLSVEELRSVAEVQNAADAETGA